MKPVWTRREMISSLFVGAALAATPSIADAKAKPNGETIIALDPGHGGHDPGAVGITGLYEKHVALDAANELKQALETKKGYQVFLTRTTDDFLPLPERVNLAEKRGADLFVSLHADALRESDVRGASVYTRAVRASDAEAQELANRENSVDNFLPPEVRNASPDVSDILKSLMLRETHAVSYRLQERIVSTLKPRIGLLHNPARHADFVVLRSAAIPSVLVEMGFMSNLQDERLLTTTNYRSKVVAGLSDAIDQCLACQALFASTVARAG